MKETFEITLNDSVCICNCCGHLSSTRPDNIILIDIICPHCNARDLRWVHNEIVIEWVWRNCQIELGR